jgi:hypothetical protein
MQRDTGMLVSYGLASRSETLTPDHLAQVGRFCFRTRVNGLIQHVYQMTKQRIFQLDRLFPMLTFLSFKRILIAAKVGYPSCTVIDCTDLPSCAS